MTTGQLRGRLLAYYRRHGRVLPWRGTADPYRVWISEIMLQQTRVVTVATRYEQFVKRFPDVRSLAHASRESVCEAWAGLGYYRRAHNLHAAAKAVVDVHGARFPRTAESLRTLPGIGRYTGGAIASIAFGEHVPAVDGNVERVLSRVFAVDDPPDSSDGRKIIFRLAANLLEGSLDPGEVNQALMDLGALVCVPRKPACHSCPLRHACSARAAGTATEYPRREARRQPRATLSVAFLWRASGHRVWLERRPDSGLWAGQWQLPGSEGPRCRELLARRFGVELGEAKVRIRHALTHRRVVASVYDYESPARWRRSDDFRAADPNSAPVHALARRAIRARMGLGFYE